jgi:PIN domain nuclease of toxin-antitoxin system
VIWVLEGGERVSPRAKHALSAASSSLCVSIVSVWEIVLKHQAGKLALDAGLVTTLDIILRDSGWTIHPLQSVHVRRLTDLPLLHRDPFDRILIAQAQAEGLTIVTPDSQIRKYDVPSVW